MPPITNVLPPVPDPYIGDLTNNWLSIPKDVGAKIYREVFLQSDAGLHPFHLTCRAVYFVWRKAFSLAYEPEIAACVQSLKNARRQHEVVYQIFDHEAIPQSIVDLIGCWDITLDPKHGWVADPRSPYLLCRRLDISCRESAQKALPAIISRSAPFLKELKLSGDVKDDAEVNNAIARCSHLTSLSLNGCWRFSFSDSSIWSSLTTLKLWRCDSLRYRFKEIAACCPQLTEFLFWSSTNPGAGMSYVRSQDAILDVDLHTIADGCSHITSINLSDCFNIRSRELKAFIKKCPSVSDIRLEGCVLPSLRDSVALLLDVPMLSCFSTRRREYGCREIRNNCSRLNIQQVVELVWACGILGFYDLDLIDAFSDYLFPKQLTLEENAKWNWACRRLGSGGSRSRPGDTKLLQALDEKYCPEKRPEHRKQAAEILMPFIDTWS